MATRTPAAVWVGRVISTLVGLMFVMSGVMKLVGGKQLEEGFTHLGLPLSLRVPLAILELTCAVIYLVPPTAVLGAILLTGYLGGAMLTHLRVGEPVYTHVAMGVALWVAVALRDGRLWRLLPVRRPAVAPVSSAHG
jgi:uncharacterized membrane protein YphA (DoxX/SURF4 family)